MLRKMMISHQDSGYSAIKLNVIALIDYLDLELDLSSVLVRPVSTTYSNSSYIGASVRGVRNP